MNMVKGVLKNERIQIATWNVRSTYMEGKLIRLGKIMKDYTVGLMAIQETKQTGIFIKEMEDYVFFNSGNESRMLGVGFLVNKKLKSEIIEFKAISNRLCRIRLRSRYRKISIINVHCPTEEKEYEEKEKFYEEIERVYNEIPKYDVKMIIGDFNAKIGKEEIYKPVIGSHSKHNESNQNGKMLIEFATERNMRIVSTCFQHKNIHKGTWISPDGKTVNQVDHLLIEAMHSKYVMDVRSYRGADIDSDHLLVKAKIKYRRPPREKKRKNTRVKYSMEKLKDEKIRKDFREKINKNLNGDMGRNIEESWEDFEIIMREGAQLLKEGKRKTTKPWFDEECKDVIAEREKARMKMINNNNTGNREQYERCRKRVKNVCRKKKRLIIEQKIKQLEDNYMKKQTREFYQGIKNERKKNMQGRLIFCKDKEGQLVGGMEESLKRWAEYFGELYGIGEEEITEIEEEESLAVEGHEEPPRKEEIKEIIEMFKNNKAPGENGVTAEMLKVGGQYLEENLFRLIKRVWEEEKMPQRWKEALICPLHKKGDVSNCENYRGIALMDIVYKIMAVAIKNRVNEVAERKIGQYQCGFRKNRSVIDQVFVLKQIIDNSIDQNLALFMLFIDFKQAYDTVKREKVYEAMREMGIKEKLIRLVRMTLKETEYKVLINGQVSEKFRVKRGLRQGDPLSTVLFNIVLNSAVKASGIRLNGLIYDQLIQVMAYADDIIIITRTRERLVQALKKLEKAAGEKGLKINEGKTKFMEVGNGSENKQNGRLEVITERSKYSFEKVNTFNYLGVTITNKGEEKAEIQERIAKGIKCMGGLLHILKSKSISRNVKKRLYKTIIRPVVIYGCETWKLNLKEKQSLEIVERKVLRRIYGGKRTGEVWERRTNKEILELYNEPSISNVARAQRMRWLGHVARLDDNIPTKQALIRGITGRRSRGRPRSKWMEMVERDLNEMGIVDWREQIRNKDEWRRKCNQAMSLLG